MSTSKLKLNPGPPAEPGPQRRKGDHQSGGGNDDLRRVDHKGMKRETGDGTRVGQAIGRLQEVMDDLGQVVTSSTRQAVRPASAIT